MKTLLRFSFLLLFTFSAFTATFAQKTVTEGSVTYEMKLAEDNPMAGMLGNTNMVLTFKGSLMKTTINVMGGMMSLNIIVDSKEDKGVMLVSAPMMGKNMAVEMTPEDMKKSKEEGNVNKAKPNIEYFKKSKKKIANYKCYKAVAKMEGLTDPITIYLCDKIKPEGQSQIQKQIPGLTGFPLSFELVQQGMKITFMATEVSTKKPADTDFDMTIPEGFEKVTMEELGGMGGLGGFGM